jgi:hypothetical protein
MKQLNFFCDRPVLVCAARTSSQAALAPHYESMEGRTHLRHVKIRRKTNGIIIGDKFAKPASTNDEAAALHRVHLGRHLVKKASLEDLQLPNAGKRRLNSPLTDDEQCAFQRRLSSRNVTSEMKQRDPSQSAISVLSSCRQTVHPSHTTSRLTQVKAALKPRGCATSSALRLMHGIRYTGLCTNQSVGVSQGRGCDS